jgi:SHS2 domain-containing protein
MMGDAAHGGYTVTGPGEAAALEVWAPDLPALFENAARALFTLIAGEEPFARETPPNHGDGTDPVTRRLEIGGRSPVELLTEWLNILNATHKFHHELYLEYTLTVTENRVSASVDGIPIDPERHDIRVVVRNVTYKGVALDRTDEGHRARIGLDV